jgi:hypothetical protein
MTNRARVPHRTDTSATAQLRVLLAALLLVALATFAAAPAFAATLTVVYPNGGQTLYRYNTYNVTWSSSGVTGDIAVDIYSGTTNLHRYNVPNTGSFNWTIDSSFLRVRATASP